MDYLFKHPLGIWKAFLQTDHVNYLEFFYRALGLQVSILLLSFAFSYWMKGRWESLLRRFPRFSNFWIQFAYFDAMTFYMYRWGSIFLKRVDGWVGRDLWSQVLPLLFSTTLRRIGKSFLALDSNSNRFLMLGSEKSLDLGSRPLRMLQNGNLQWYLSFGLFVGLGLLLGPVEV